jgi:hypothetical protein
MLQNLAVYQSTYLFDAFNIFSISITLISAREFNEPHRIYTSNEKILISFLLTPSIKMEQSVPKRRRIKFRHRGITQKKEYGNLPSH